MSKRKFFIKRVVSGKTYNVNGELIRTDYQYVICYKRFWIFSRYVYFYEISISMEDSKIDDILLKEVKIRYITNIPLFIYMATFFDSEKDAKKVLQDMMEHPNKYVYKR